MTTLWKSMRAGMLSGFGEIGPWKVGKWRKNNKPLVMCTSGFHASVRAVDAMCYVNCEVLALVEVKGKHLEQADKQVWESMRIIKAHEWTRKDSVAMAIYAAELVLPIFEKKYPDNKQPRKAIEAAKKGLENPTEENRQAAAASAAYAAYAASSAAYAADAAYAASSAAYAADAADAASAADAAARASYSYAAASAASARTGTLDKVEAWIQERVKTLREVS